MKKLAIIFVVTCATAAVGWVGLRTAWEHYFPKSVIHYRLDVTFEVDGIRVTGSSVQELVVSRALGLSEKRASWRAFGEAVVVDLPGHGAIFVLLTSPTVDSVYTGSTKGRFDNLIYDACSLKEKRAGKSWSEFVRMTGKLSGACNVPPEELPLMVYFKDISDPETIQRLIPEQVQERFGPNVDFVGATVTITEEPLTLGVGSRLPWLSDYPEPALVTGKPSTNPPFSQIIKHGYFRRLER